MILKKNYQLVILCMIYCGFVSICVFWLVALLFETIPFDTYLLTHTFICQIVDILHFFKKWSLPIATYHLTQIWICQIVDCLHFWYNNQYNYGIYLENKGVARGLNDLGWVAWIDLCYLWRRVTRKMTWGDLY